MAAVMSCYLLPERSVDSKFVGFLDQATNVVADDFAENFIDHRHIGLAANVIAELRFDHREHGLDVAPLVVVAQKILAAILEIVEHLGPHSARPARSAALERDVGNRAVTCGGFEVFLAAVALVG